MVANSRIAIFGSSHARRIAGFLPGCRRFVRGGLRAEQASTCPELRKLVAYGRRGTLDHIIIFIGSNDIGDQFRRDRADHPQRAARNIREYVSLVTEILRRELPHTNLLLSDLWARDETPVWRETQLLFNSQIAALNCPVLRVAKHIKLQDLFDGVHLNHGGQKKLLAAIWRHL